MRLLYFLLAVSSCLVFSYSKLTDVAVAGFLDSIPPNLADCPLCQSVPPDSADTDESISPYLERTESVPPNPVDVTTDDNVNIENCKKSSSDSLCIYTGNLTKEDEELLNSLINKVFNRKVIYLQDNSLDSF